MVNDIFENLVEYFKGSGNEGWINIRTNKESFSYEFDFIGDEIIIFQDGFPQERLCIYPSADGVCMTLTLNSILFKEKFEYSTKIDSVIFNDDSTVLVNAGGYCYEFNNFCVI